MRGGGPQRYPPCLPHFPCGLPRSAGAVDCLTTLRRHSAVIGEMCLQIPKTTSSQLSFQAAQGWRRAGTAALRPGSSGTGSGQPALTEA